MKLALLVLLWLAAGNPKALPSDSGIASGRVRLAHQFHGILHSVEDLNGEEYFIRNDKRCRLFTKAFEQWLEGRRKQ